MTQEYLRIVSTNDILRELNRRIENDVSSSSEDCSEDGFKIDATHVMVVIKNVRRYYMYRALTFKLDEKERKLKKYMKKRPKAKVFGEIEFDRRVVDLWPWWVSMGEEHVDCKGTRFNLVDPRHEHRMIRTMMDERYGPC